MKIKLTIGEKEKITLQIKRNWFSGRFTYKADNIKYTIKSPYDPNTHFNPIHKNEYDFEVGDAEKHKIKIHHKTPSLFAGFRPQEFEIYVDGQLFETYRGY